MLYDILQDEEFAAILKNHATSLIKYLLEKDQPFGVLADTKRVIFNPELPQEIKSNFSEFTLFLIMNYTFETAQIKEGHLTFEAGFGPNNFGSIVKVPIDSILQIIVDETPIFINLSVTVTKHKTENVKSSMEALLSNPENQKLLKKRKKKM